ncbi:hypothetical protein D5086_005921 [Populus alba]|uniref:Uncharacterized protein n=3 Tax=Populus TaxID=3689 RepID=A0ACC4CJA3_POPAL|nr:hypothetical protein NC653_007820 [Populus alba x Populus x berolinensis]TKS10951.1 hypothetical protein D5086_0000078200 [Populus alba]
MTDSCQTQVGLDNVRPVEFNAYWKQKEWLKLQNKLSKGRLHKLLLMASPAKLRIEHDDPEDVKAARRKKIHAFQVKDKGFEQLEAAQNKRQDAWQQLQTTKGKTKKVGFFSGRKKESIFKSPDDPKGKVGVAGSGKGLTEFQKREKHWHLKGGSVETGD